MYILSAIFRRLIRLGSLSVLDASGKTHVFSGAAGPNVSIQIHDRRLPWKIVFFPSLGIGEGYMDGRLSIINGTVYEFLELIAINLESHGHHPFHIVIEKFQQLFKRWHQYNPVYRSLNNVSRHYDLSNSFYKLFLDENQQYSCGYFLDKTNSSLETAQIHKMRHICSKLIPARDLEILDVGSGWGGLSIYLAKILGANVTGITLSKEQLENSRKNAANAGLTEQVKFYMRDYRDQDGQFDRIVSVGMFEHVGVSFYSKYFKKVKNLLSTEGVALIHTIGRSGKPSVTDPWIRKYIFRGGYIPALSEVVPVVEKVGLTITDIEFLGPHYAETIRHWRSRFQSNRATALQMYDERFCRMWEFYLAGSEISFRFLGMTVFQIQLTNKHGVVPMDRGYIEREEEKIDQLGIDETCVA